LKIRGIKKATWNKKKIKNSKIQGEILKAPRGLIQVQKHPKKIHRNAQKVKKIKKKIKRQSLRNSNRKPLRNLKSQNSNFIEKSNSP
jgi:hypothetical protein